MVRTKKTTQRKCCATGNQTRNSFSVLIENSQRIHLPHCEEGVSLEAKEKKRKKVEKEEEIVYFS